jgi:hypothetical protein
MIWSSLINIMDNLELDGLGHSTLQTSIPVITSYGDPDGQC